MGSDMTTSVTIGYVHNDHVHAGFMHSLVNLIRYMSIDTLDYWSSANISTARNKLVEQFLESGNKWLYMADTDTVFNRNTIERLLKRNEAIIGGLVHINDLPKYPSMFRREPDDENGTPAYRAITEYEQGEVVDVDATGAGCLLVHRQVFLDIQEKLPNKAAQWFQEIPMGEYLAGEDVTFCIRAISLGYNICVDTSVNIGHLKTHII